MVGASGDVWEVMSTARTIRRFTDEPVDDITPARCLEAATRAPSAANAQGSRFAVLRSPEGRAAVAKAAAQALRVIEPVYGMSRPAAEGNSRRARKPTGRPTNCTIERGSSLRCCSRRGTFRRHPNSAGRSSRP